MEQHEILEEVFYLVKGNSQRLVRMESGISDVKESSAQMEERLIQVEERLEKMEERLIQVEERLEKMEERLIQVEERLDKMEGCLFEMERGLDLLEESMDKSLARQKVLEVNQKEMKVQIARNQDNILENFGALRESRTLLRQHEAILQEVK